MNTNIVTDKEIKAKIIELLQNSRIKPIEFKINPINDTIRVMGNILESEEASKFATEYVGIELTYNEDNQLQLGDKAIKGDLTNVKRFVSTY